MRRAIAWGCLLVFAGLLGVAQAQEAANPTGTWKWETQGRRGGQPRASTLKLKLEEDKLTGVFIGGRNNQETAITEGSFKEGTVTFKVTRQFGDNEFTQTYTGKLEGDTIKGTITFEIQGESREREWEAKRDTEAQA